MLTGDTLLDLVANRQRDPGASISSRLSPISTGRIFPVHPDPWGRTHILNAAELCLLDYLARPCPVQGVDAVCDRCPVAGGLGYVSRDGLPVYREAMDDCGLAGRRGADAGPAVSPHLKDRESRSMAQGGITAGHYLRGLSSD